MFRKKIVYGIVILSALCLMTQTMTAYAQKTEKKDSSDDRVAVVNGVDIPAAEFNAESLAVQKAYLNTGRPLTCAQLSTIRVEVIESLIRRELLHQESRKAGISADKKQIDAEIEALKKNFLADADYKNELKRRNLSEEKLRAQIERNLKVGEYINREYVLKTKVTDAETMDYYTRNVHLLKQPQQAKVSHVLIASDPKWETSRKQEARRKAEKIQKDVKSGKDFSAAARETSDGPTRTAGGDLGYVKRGQLEKQFEDVVFSMNKGEISPVIETSHGFHIFSVTDTKPENILSYDSVKDRISKILQVEKAKKEAELHARKLREKAKVEIFVQ